MEKSSIVPLPKFFDRYINLVEQENLLEALDETLTFLENLNLEKLHKIGDKVYAPNKWQLTSVFQHILDNERIQSARALRIARNEKIEHPGYDENAFADNSFADDRRLEDIIEELILTRKSIIALYKSFKSSQLHKKGVCSGIEISVLALGFQIVGHQIHHWNVIEERYFPLV
jgi:hypothetical protein